MVAAAGRVGGDAGEASNLAVLVSSQTGRAIQAIDLVLRDLQRAEPGDAAMAGEPAGPWPKILAARRGVFVSDQRLPMIKSFARIDSRGVMLRYVGAANPGRIDVSDRDYFRFFAQGGADELFISTPMLSRIDGDWTIFLARRRIDGAGRFAGVVVAGLPVSYFRELLASLVLPADTAFTLLRRDGLILTHQPDPAPTAGTRMPSGSDWFMRVVIGGGTYEGYGQFDGVRRIVAVQPVGAYPPCRASRPAYPAVQSHPVRRAAACGAGDGGAGAP